MARPKLQCSLVSSTVATSILVTYAGNPYTINLAADTVYADTDTLLAALELDIETQTGAAWTFAVTVSTGKVSITAPLAFSWDWNTATWCRDWLGYDVNGVAVGPAWTARFVHLGGFYPDEQPQFGVETDAATTSAMTRTASAIDATLDASTVYASRRDIRSLRIRAARTAAGAWDEIAEYWLFLDYVIDGRQFSVWPDSLVSTKFLFHLQGPARIPLARRFGRSWRYYQMDWIVSEVQA